MQRFGILVAAVLLTLNLPVLAVHPAQAVTSLAQQMKQVDMALDTAIRNLNAAEERVSKKQVKGVEKSMDLVRDAETKIGQALGIFKQLEATKPSKEQIEQIQRLLADAQAQLKQAGTLIDQSGQRSQDHKLIRGLVTGAGNQVGKAMKALRQMAVK